MTVEAREDKNMMEDMDDDDDAPLVFKRSGSSSKPKQSEPENKLSSQKHNAQVGRQSSDVRPQNGTNANAQKGKSVTSSSSMKPPVRPSLVSPKSSNSSVKASPIKSPDVNSKPSTSVVGESKSVKSTIKEENSEDSEDDKPLSARQVAGSSKNNPNQTNKPNAPNLGKKSNVPKPEDSDDEIPLSAKFQGKSNAGASTSRSSHSEEKKPLVARKPDKNGSASTERKPSTVLQKRPADGVASAGQSNLKKPKLSDSLASKDKKASVKPEVKAEDDEDLVPLSQRTKKSTTPEKKPSPALKVTKSTASISKKTNNKTNSKTNSKTNKKSKQVSKDNNYSKSSKLPPSSGDGQKWTTLVHNGVIFPPPYKPHGVKMLYKGKPVNLTPEQEEVATMYAVMLETDYLKKPQFKENFMTDWKKILGKNHVIQSLEHCDFTPIYEWHQREKEKKKQMSTDEKKALKEEKLKLEEKYMWAVLDGVREKVGNFRVEPPGLFRGRGEHPKMGKLKRRIRPSDITINIGRDAPIPECPIEGERWKEIRHDNTVTWLAYWSDPINGKEFKYVFLAASSTLKGQSDKEKYEKARLLKDYIQGIRTAYTRDFVSKDPAKKQIAVATYLIDKLALRAGNEKDDDEADTVGCCTLKVENVEPVPPNILKFDFLGKDSIRYQNEVEVETAVFKAIQQFRSGKKGGDDLFDKLDTSKLNAHLKELMPGLTAKVFRTYNASITLDDKLSRETKGGDLAEKVVTYNHANKEVAIICNHQRTVSKTHSAQMLRLDEKIDELKGVLEELKTDLGRARKGKPLLAGADGKAKRNINPEALERKIAQTTAKIEKMERDKETKEDLKTVALGTSKINYLDPRITVAWCKRHEVPIEKMFNKSLLEKFSWAMDVDPSFRF
ncbi:PREDICTED: DNA topoisomerase 1-like [Erythranthe guttata]|uniref:DNA topoisomerase 1-like n=1 Tax=Erythranthe guttata TaxID=4155 RepID=UPI00064DB862|nr:PREDICTED: DNA topoisomerase 1-like [Erythranthe guttata]|eukprot:XP_012845487.1 PREDICTED: DNA topoisomerase 1-like [Erythranthe guttata]